MPRNPSSRPPAPEGIGFYGAPFSSFTGGPYRVDVRIQWPEAEVFPPFVVVRRPEHYFQAAKTHDRVDSEWVLSAPLPGMAKRRGSYHGEKQPDGTWRRITLREDWEEIRFEVMLHAHLGKYKALSGYRRALLSTGDAFLYEDSPTDDIWGLWDKEAWDWTGQNLLGKVLMQVREELR